MTVGSFALGPDPDVTVERFYNSDDIVPGPFVNNSPYRNPEVDRLFAEQRTQADLAGRKAIYDLIQALIWADVPVFPVCATRLPGVARTSAVTGLYDVETSNREDYAKPHPAKA